MPDYRQLNLPADLCARAEQKFGQRFASIEDLLVFVLKDLTDDRASQMDAAEQSLIEARLRDLGYL
jgi:hypothetical protein